MKDLMAMKIVEGGHKLLCKIEKSIYWWRSEIFIKVFESPWNVFHEDASLVRKMVVLEVSYYVFMMHFGENRYLGF